MRPSAIHIPLAGKAAKELRQSYVQRYLKQFLRRVHPDLFQHHPKEQAQNSASLQELLPIVGYDKQKRTAIVPPAHGSDTLPLTTKLSFYIRPAPAAAATTTVTAAANASPPPLTLIEHNLPLPHVPTQALTEPATLNIPELEQELQSWEMVRSFMQLCTKVGVPVTNADEQCTQEQQQALHMAVQQAKAGPSPKQTERSLKEIFAEELQGSFAGSSGKTTESLAWKVGGGYDVEEQARHMIESNPLLFTSAEVSRARLEKTMRKWLYWQEEDKQQMFREQLRTSEGTKEGQAGTVPRRNLFRLQDWWRKVPVYVAGSSREQARILQEMHRQGRGGMVVVAQDAKMIEYLAVHLPVASEEYQAQMLEHQKLHHQPQRAVDDDVGAQYLARMRAKHARIGQGQRGRGRS
ncbi:hypothetical protein BGZ73_008427 [Actinomortierella ambigua]|nr:hypothetical protein BGZ73_008427 [Actinomortierella ambigua]